VSESRSQVRRLLRLGGAIIVFLMLAGATYQGVATALERREFPRPGGLVSIGDHQLHLFCVGNGAPAVVLEAPAAASSAAWGDIQQRLARTTRVCAYDRSGLGWSEAGDRPYDPGRVPEELRALLESAGENGPFVVAGHGLGAAFARMYAGRADADATALIEIDPPAADAAHDARLTWIMPAAPWMARVGLLRASRMLSSKADALGGTSGEAMRAFLNRPDHLTRAAAEVAKWDDAVRLAERVAVPVPVTTVTTGGDDRERISFLADTPGRDRVLTAVEAAVRQWRQKTRPAMPSPSPVD
jgi:pimeloyl-ACP methyl ester carboxylesterase